MTNKKVKTTDVAFGDFHTLLTGSDQKFTKVVEFGPGTLFGQYSENWIFGIDANKTPVCVREEDLTTPRIQN